MRSFIEPMLQGVKDSWLLARSLVASIVRSIQQLWRKVDDFAHCDDKVCH